jgi:hypothetical protein
MKLSSRDEEGRRGTVLTDGVRIAICVVSPLLLGALKRFCEFDCAEDVCDAFEVVSHRGETHFDLCTGQPAHQEPWMAANSLVICQEMNDWTGRPCRRRITGMYKASE